MNKLLKLISIYGFICLNLLSFRASAQDRFAAIEAKLQALSVESPGLNEKVELSVNGVNIQEFIRGLASSNGLNVSVNASLNTKIINNFSNATVADVFLFLCKNYDLDINFIGSIMSFSQYAPSFIAPKIVSKQIKISYDKETGFLNMDLANDSLSLVAKELTKASGKNVVFAPELNNKMINGFIQNLPITNALDKLAFANDLKITASDNDVYLIEKKTTEEKSNTSGNRNNKNNSATPLPAGLTIKVDDQLITADAVNVPIVDIIGVISRELKYNYYLYSEPKGNTTLSVKKVNYEDFLKNLLNGSDYTFKKEGEMYLIGDRNIENIRTTKVVQLKYRTVEKIIDFFPAEIKKDVDIKAFPDLNSIILSGSEPRINEIEAFLRSIDRVVPVVVIEVLIVDINDSKTLSTGIEAGLGQAPIQTGGKVGSTAGSTLYPGVDLSLSSSSLNDLISGINGLGVVNLGKVTPNFYLKLKALETQGVLRLRSTPKLATLNGHEAKMSIGSTEYYQEIQTTVLGSVTSATQTAFNWKSVNASLSVSINPMVSGDEQITLDIAVKQSSFTPRVSATAPPGSITRDFQSMIRIKNEEMIILGGLEENSTNNSGSGIPFLSRIPVLKWFFSSRSREIKKSKLSIFIKPTVLY